MANGNDPGSLETNDGRPQLSAIEERLARLERQLAALQLQVAGHTAAPAPAALASTPPPPPPIPPRPELTPATPTAPAAARISSAAWTSTRPAPAHQPESRDSFESRLGAQVFNRIAIVALLIGTALGMKLAVDHGLIGPAGRVVLGLIAGAALVLWSERFRKKNFAAFSYSLKAVGSGVLYLSLWAAFRHGLLPTSVALGLMVLVTAWNAYMAWAQDAELLAVYALAGGFATPLLLSTGGNHETFLFTYLFAIVAATVALVRLRNWPRLLIGAFPLTVAYFAGWYAQFYSPDEFATTSTFLILFAATFASVPLARTTSTPPVLRSTILEDILLPLANSVFATIAFYAMLQDSGDKAFLPWLMVALAAVYLALMRVPQTAVASAIHLSIAVVLLTIAVPLKASGHWITVSWLVEGLALLWVAARLSPPVSPDESSSYASTTLRWLGTASLLLGFCGVTVHLLGVAQAYDIAFLNHGTGTALTAVVIFAAVAWLALRAATTTRISTAHTESWPPIAMFAFVFIALTAVLLTLRELVFSLSFYSSYPHPAFQSVDFAMALVALAIFAAVVAISLQIARDRTGEAFWVNCAAISTIAFNLIAILTGVREIAAVWGPTTPDAALQQALAISAYLMLYGAALLAAGFWRRSGFLRWQALLLLLFTICKTFLYDMRNLSQGYRVVSFLGLGALLLAISFAYQKDWLNLRKPAPEPPPNSGASK